MQRQIQIQIQIQIKDKYKYKYTYKYTCIADSGEAPEYLVFLPPLVLQYLTPFKYQLKSQVNTHQHNIQSSRDRTYIYV